MRRFRTWRGTHPWTTAVVLVVALSVAAALGEVVTGYGRFATAAGFFMFAGLVFGAQIAEWASATAKRNKASSDEREPV